jgi:hypothetical protein
MQKRKIMVGFRARTTTLDPAAAPLPLAFYLTMGRFCLTMAALYVVAAAVAETGRRSNGSRPNFVFILADDLDFDYKQDRLAIMPNLKRLREAGLHLVNHVAAQPVCGPSRSSLLAGRYPCVLAHEARARNCLPCPA